MPIDFDALLKQQGAALTADPAWLGSAAHLNLLQQAVADIHGMADVTVIWVAAGQQGYWEASTRTIATEQPTTTPNMTPQAIAKFGLLGLIHEALHATHTTPAAAYRSRLAAVDPRSVATIDRLFNLLEDGRITALGRAMNPGLTAGLNEFIDEAVRQCSLRAKTNGPTTDPASQPHQLLYALEFYALSSELPSRLHPDVAVAANQLTGKIDATHQGETVGCGMAALELYADVAAYRPPA